MGSIGTEEAAGTISKVYSFNAVLTDFDGTIIDSTPAIVKHWQWVGQELGVDGNEILKTSHGRRSIDVLQLYDSSKANWDYVSYVEGLIPKKYGAEAVEIPGSRDFLANLDALHAPWAVVTSGTTALISGWISNMKLAQPQQMVVAEDVKKGKPDPECYKLGLEKLGMSDAESVLVVEDAPSGIKAGKAAGYLVLALLTTHTLQQVRDAGADWIVQDLRSVRVETFEQERINVRIVDTL